MRPLGLGIIAPQACRSQECDKRIIGTRRIIDECSDVSGIPSHKYLIGDDSENGLFHLDKASNGMPE
jgi:hypothetical protein